MVRIFVAFIVTGTIAILSQNCFAMSVNEYRSLKAADKESTVLYLVGVFEGFEWSNTYIRLRKEEPLYCRDAKLQLNAQNITQILESYLDTEEGKAMGIDYPVELALLNGLNETFPCGS